jgi:hypothetical protein
VNAVERLRGIKESWDAATEIVRRYIKDAPSDQLEPIRSGLESSLADFAERQQKAIDDGVLLPPDDGVLTISMTLQIVETEQRRRHLQSCEKCRHNEH